MTTSNLETLLARHRAYFRAGQTRPVAWREAQLRALQALMTERAEDFFKALWTDLRRNRVDGDATDVEFVAREADYARRRVRRWMRPKHERTPLIFAPGRTIVRFDPLGVGLIIGAWNYPIMLCLSPLVAAIAAGNAAVIKPSEVSSACAETIAQLLPKYLDPDAFSVVLGGVAETTALLEQRWDHIFFTGGPPVGKIVMTAAAKNLTPVVLELGGKNPTIVHSSADVRVAARRIVQGRFVNAGQTCTAPDYVLVFRDVAASFLRELKAAIIAFYGVDPQKSPDYGRMISERHFDRVVKLLSSGDVRHGGQHDRADLYIAPTILTNVAATSLAMQEEIFGPVLAVLEVDTVETVLDIVNGRPAPLALYVFATDRAIAERLLDETSSGDAVINDCTVQPLVRELPFGGVGHSGMGKYHGEWGLRAYTNARGVLYRSTKLDPSVRYPPYRKYARLRDFLMRRGG
jgi:acyl-CoA reductase-like NAD-dependent aldehyde dehydrogenase